MSSNKKRNASTLDSDDAAGSGAPSTSTATSSSSTPQPAEKKLKNASATGVDTKLTRQASGNAPPTPTSAASKFINQLSSLGSASALTPKDYSAIAAANAAKFKSYTVSTVERAHTVLHEILPKKVLELDYLTSTVENYTPSVSVPFDDKGAFLQGKEKAPVESNPSVMKLIPVVKKEITQLIEYMGALKLMIQLRIPAVEDGNNYGVEVQDEAVNEVAKVEDLAFNQLEKIQAYYGNRTRIVAKVSKYPAILDYWSAVMELDEAFYTDLRLHCIDIRNAYATIHDLLLKNEAKILHPRDGPAEHAYRHYG